MSQGESGPAVSIAGASRLIEIYGYWLSFHDAVVERVTIERVGPSVTIQFTTCDMADNRQGLQAAEVEAKVVIRWYEVRELHLDGIDPSQHNWIDGLTFSREGEDIRCEIELMDALQGVIVARRVEVVEVEPL